MKKLPAKPPLDPATVPVAECLNDLRHDAWRVVAWQHKMTWGWSLQDAEVVLFQNAKRVGLMTTVTGRDGDGYVLYGKMVVRGAV